MLKLNHLRYSSYSSNLGVDFLRRNFNVHFVEVEMAYSGT